MRKQVIHQSQEVQLIDRSLFLRFVVGAKGIVVNEENV